MVVLSQDARAMFQELRQRGARLALVDERLEVRFHKGALPDEWQDFLRALKPDLVAILQEEQRAIAWRMASMRPQLPPTGPIPFLVARPEALAGDAPGACLSCGEHLDEGQRFRCKLCLEAVQRVLREGREAEQKGGKP